MPQPTSFVYLGIARETTRGTAVAATDFIPIRTFAPKDVVKYLDDVGLRGSMVKVYNEVQGPIYAEVDFGGDAFADTIGYPMMSIMGDTAQTGSTPTNSTTLAAASAVGATSISSTATFAASSVIQIDTGVSGKSEVRTVTSVTGSGPFTVNFAAPLNFAHSSGVTVANVVAPYTHNFAVMNLTSSQGQPVSYTISDTYIPFVAANTRQYAGFQAEEVAFKFQADGLLEYSAKGKSFKSATAANPTAAFSTEVPMAVWHGTATIGGASNLNVQSGEVTLKRPVNPIWNVAGSQNPKSIWDGALEVDGKLMFIMEDDTELTRYLTNTQPPLTLAFTQPAPAGGNETIQVALTKAAYTVGNITRGKDYIELDTTFKGVGNTTDVGGSFGFGNGKLTLVNTRVGGVYG